MDAYTAELFNEGLIDLNEASRSVVNELNAEIERRLIGLTVNAPDWYVFLLDVLLLGC